MSGQAKLLHAHFTVFSDHSSLSVPNIVKHRLHDCFICNYLPRSRELTLWIFVEEEDLLDLAREDGHDLGEGGLDVPPLPGLGPPVDDDREPGALQFKDRSVSQYFLQYLEKAPSSAFSWLKTPTSAFTRKNLL